MIAETKKEEQVIENPSVMGEIENVEADNAEAFTAEPAADAVEPSGNGIKEIKPKHEAQDLRPVHEAAQVVGGQAVGSEVSAHNLGQSEIQPNTASSDNIFPPLRSTGELAKGEGKPLDMVEKKRWGLLRFAIIPKILGGSKEQPEEVKKAA